MRIQRSIMLSSALALAVAAPSIADSPHPAPGSQSDSVVIECNDQGDTVALDGPTLLWPPNHKMVDITITMDDAQGSTSEFVTTSTHDEIIDGEEMNGSGNTPEDAADADVAASDPAVGTVSIRSERSGQGDGRVYTISVDGMAGSDECNHDFFIVVPHDMRPENRVKPDNG